MHKDYAIYTPWLQALARLGLTYTIAAVGLVADGSLTAQVHEDDLRASAAGNAKVRVVHASPDAGPVAVVPGEASPSSSRLHPAPREGRCTSSASPLTFVRRGASKQVFGRKSVWAWALHSERQR